ncbi:O-acyltransferase like protein-like [Clytia hemisphaerica]|uniref:Nose resistant-to-fluoxetine protein N-terminal domain-containing protein n=1 Tax=Clytia hemisphaerica TaxID=252671 RepID=A0A7M5XD23_9CNID
MKIELFFYLVAVSIISGNNGLEIDVQQPIKTDIGSIVQHVTQQQQHLKDHRLNLMNVMDDEWAKKLGHLNGFDLMKEVGQPGGGDGFPKLDVSLKCQASLMQLFGPVMNITNLNPAVILALLGQPVGKVLDTWGKPPSRFLMGDFSWLGAYDECKGVEEVKYCRATFFFAKQYQFPGTYGMCFPDQCTQEELAKLLPLFNQALQNVITFAPTTMACESPLEYSTGNYLAILLCAFLAFMVCLGTFTEMIGNALHESFKNDVKPPVTDTSHEVAEFKPEKGDSGNSGELSTRIMKTGHDFIGRSFLYDFATSFSLIRNMKAILSTESPKGAITSLNGIRTLSMTWVILGHMYAFGSMPGFAYWDNPLQILKILNRFSFMVVSNAYVSVDTFFLLSGVLVAYLTFRRMDAKNGYPVKLILMGYLHRYIRLTPSLIFLMIFMNNIFPLLVTGPSSFLIRSPQLTKPCDDYWWTNILYINNFYPDGMSGQCVGWVWYLANDMQFYLISPFILILLFKLDQKYAYSRIRYLVTGGVMGALSLFFIGITALLMGVYHLPAVQSAGGIAGNPKMKDGTKFMDRIYEKPYTRITPYLVGLYLGYLLHRRVTIKFNLRLIIGLIGWLVAIATALSVVYGTWKVFDTPPVFFTDAEDIIYEAFHRFAWAVAVGWVIYACQNRLGGFVDSFLSWKFWIPLSRLTYGAYLMHPLVIFYFYMAHETTQHYQDNIFIFNIISCTSIAYVASFLLAIFVEFPILNLEKKFLG